MSNLSVCGGGGICFVFICMFVSSLMMHPSFLYQYVLENPTVQKELSLKWNIPRASRRHNAFCHPIEATINVVKFQTFSFSFL